MIWLVFFFLFMIRRVFRGFWVNLIPIHSAMIFIFIFIDDRNFSREFPRNVEKDRKPPKKTKKYRAITFWAFVSFELFPTYSNESSTLIRFIFTFTVDYCQCLHVFLSEIKSPKGMAHEVLWEIRSQNTNIALFFLSICLFFNEKNLIRICNFWIILAVESKTWSKRYYVMISLYFAIRPVQMFNCYKPFNISGTHSV